MSAPNLSSIQGRFNEVSAVSAAVQIVKRLHEAACAPSGKQYIRQSEQRCHLWAELQEIASDQNQALQHQPPAKKRVPRSKPPTVGATGVPISVVESEQKA